MKKILLLLLLAVCLVVAPNIDSKAQNGTVTITEATIASDSASVKGTTEDTLAIMVRITDASDNILVMQSFAVSIDGSFEVEIKDVTFADGDYTISVADYEGGEWATETVTVGETTSPSPGGEGTTPGGEGTTPGGEGTTPGGESTSPSPSPIEVITPSPSPEPTPTPTPEPTATPVAKLNAGDIIESEKYNAEYKILKTGDKDGKVGKLAYLGPIKQKKAHTVHSKVTINGITYKVTAIAAYAFNGNTTLEKIKIGKYVTKIGKKAFYGCTSLKTVEMGSGITIIGTKAFANTPALKKVIIASKLLTAENIGEAAFKKAGTSKNKPTFEVPSKVLKSYTDLLGKYGKVVKSK